MLKRGIWVYKKYIYKNGKKIGPYYYESKRIGSTIKTVYLGTKPRKKVALPPPEPIINQNFFILLLISLSILGLFFLKAYTGFTIIQPYADSLNLNINHSQSYIWEVQNPGDLNYLKVSGLILGTGNVKISIQNNNLTYVILDSSIPNLLTGSVIEPDIYNIIDTSKKEKENTSKQGNLTPENINETSLLEDLSIEDIILSGIYFIVDATKKDKTINITSSNESEISQSSLNLTEDKIISRFTEVCVETCVLINFSSNSYKFLFELENATVVLENIEYSIKIPEIQQENISQIQLENLTSNIKNISIENLTLNQTLNLALENITAIPNISGLEIKDSKKQKIKYNIIKQDKDELEIEIQNKHIRKIDFKGIKNLTDLYIDDVPKEKITEKKFEKIYAIDPTLLDFDNATLTIKATGNELYKCKDWNFTEQKCYGLWVKILKLKPGEDYSFVITKEDPAFGEINITKALHLDSNYSLISDIYDEVKAKDDIWSELIYNNEYARVTFYQNLTNENDITVYVRNIQGSNTFIEVYSEDSQNKIVEFPMMVNEGYYQVLLKNMTGSYQVFDLKIKSDNPNAYLEFDHIIDPINLVALNDPVITGTVFWSSTWFWMNCTVTAQGQPDTADQLWFEHFNEATAMRKIPTNTTTSTINSTGTNPVDPFVYGLMFRHNTSTPNAGVYSLRCLANNTAGTTITSVVKTITVLQTNATFNQSTLSLSAQQNATQSFLQTANITSFGTNNDVNISCLTGSCSTITANFTSLDLLDNGTKTVFFNCSTSTIGFFSANFTVNSTEYQNSTLSNIQQMNVSCSITDSSLPSFSNVQANDTLIFTGEQVNFSAKWTDNIGLSSYIFTWNNSGAWINASAVKFNGLSNVSQNISNITAPANTYVCWKFLANDTNDNWNMAMDNQCFTVSASYCNGNFNNSNANFDISTNVLCANETMNIDGNITISSNGNLTFKNITLIFQSKADGSNFINKTENGGLWIYDNDNNQSTVNDASNITSNNTDFEYNFWAYGKGLRDNFTLQNSIITEMGYPTVDSRGIQIFNISNVTVSGNNISGGAQHGILLNYSSNNNITGNSINSPVAFAILNVNSISNNITNNTIMSSGDNGKGIYLNSNSTLNNLTSNTITTSGSNGYGIYVSDSDSNIIQDNIIATTGINGSAILLDLASDFNVIRNNIAKTNNSGGHGIHFASGAGSSNVTNNTITTNGSNGFGVRISAGSNSSNISGNTIITNGNIGHGISFATNSNSNDIINNTITTNGNGSYSIHVTFDSNLNRLSGNIITTNGTSSYGIFLQSSSDLNITDNTITTNGDNADGFYIDRSNGNIIQSNTLKFSARDGIRIGNFSTGKNPLNNTIINNNITNATNGISIFMNTTRPFAVNHTIENNNITFTINAIYIQNSSNINISLGVIRNSTNGIVLFNSKQVNTTNITFISNTYDFNITNGSTLTSINNSFNKTVKVLDESNFTIMWFAEVYVNDNQSNTNVSVWNSTNVFMGNKTTNSNGLTSLFLLTEYIRNNSANLTSNNPFNFTADNTTFFNSTSKNITQSQRITISFLAGPAEANTVPTVNNLTLTPTFPNTTINLNCSFIITDPNADTLTVNLTWYKNNTINKTYTGISVTNGTLNLHYLNNANTTKNDNWTCGVRPYDATDWGNEVNSSIVTIQNSQPTAPTLSSPADGNKTTNKTETFYWNPSTDPDNDAITYTINISCWGGCSADNRLVNTTSVNYTPAELRYFIDDNYYYNWTVKAIDTDANSSSYAPERNLSLQVLVSITLPNSTVLFGTKNIGDSVNTSNNTPSPIVMQNDGNSYINVNLSSQSTLFTTQPNPSTNYQYKIDNTSLEAGSFNWTGSVTTWTNIPLQNNTAVNLLNYSNLNDTAEMDILITVPSNEPPGNLTSNLILTGYYIANYP